MKINYRKKLETLLERAAMIKSGDLFYINFELGEITDRIHKNLENPLNVWLGETTITEMKKKMSRNMIELEHDVKEEENKFRKK